MKYKGQEVVSVTISYRLPNGQKCSVSSSPDGVFMMMRGMERDGATEVKIAHYFGKSGRMIKDVQTRSTDK